VQRQSAAVPPLPIAQPQDESAASPLPIAQGPAAPLTIKPPLLSHGPQTARASQSADVATPKDRGVRSSREPVTLVAPEIQNDSANSERPEIIWRKSPDGPPTARTDAPPMAHHTAPAVTSAPAASAPFTRPSQAPFTPAAAALSEQAGRPISTPALAQTPSPPVQVEQLSPQVIRVISERVLQTIMLDLKLERERGGINKWR